MNYFPESDKLFSKNKKIVFITIVIFKSDELINFQKVAFYKCLFFLKVINHFLKRDELFSKSNEIFSKM